VDKMMLAGVSGDGVHHASSPMLRIEGAPPLGPALLRTAGPSAGALESHLC